MKLYYDDGQFQLPGKQSKGAERHEIPTDAPGLCAWLNDRRVEPQPYRLDGARTVLPAPAPEPTTARLEMAKEVVRRRSAQEIVDFLFEEASVAQVENIMAAIGTRVAELAKAVRNG